MLHHSIWDQQASLQLCARLRCELCRFRTYCHYPYRPEQARLDDGSTITRPVIRLERPHPIMLTRIRPESKETSMIVRPRPNWEELRGVLAGDAEPGPDGKPKLRCGCEAVGTRQRGSATSG